MRTRKRELKCPEVILTIMVFGRPRAGRVEIEIALIFQFSSKSTKLIVHASKYKNVTFQNVHQLELQSPSRVVNYPRLKLIITITLLPR